MYVSMYIYSCIFGNKTISGTILEFLLSQFLLSPSTSLMFSTSCPWKNKVSQKFRNFYFFLTLKGSFWMTFHMAWNRARKKVGYLRYIWHELFCVCEIFCVFGYGVRYESEVSRTFFVSTMVSTHLSIC